MSFLGRLFPPSTSATIDRINRLEALMQAKSDRELAEITPFLKKRREAGESHLALLPEAFAAVREAARRTLGMRHFDVQLQGGIELAQGNIAEMKTGEGKTLVATLPVYLFALDGLGVHVVTVNDYLARRDAEWMGQVYDFMGLSTGCIQEEMGDGEEEDRIARQTAYAADITYATNSELVFDDLRDNLAQEVDERVHRGFHAALVDEADLILLDEAQTPLIISGPGDSDNKLFARVDKVIGKLKENKHFVVDRKIRAAAMTEEGLQKVEAALGVGPLDQPDNLPFYHAVHQSLQAHGVFRKDVEYIVSEGRVFLVDEHTGRVSPDKRFSDGLHQALEAKERVPIREEDRTYAKTSYQYFFLKYKHLCGMTGTAWGDREELRKVYNLRVKRIETHRPMIRTDYQWVIFRNKIEKFDAVADEIEDMREIGRPVLVGTTHVEESEQLSAVLKRRGIKHAVLNAKQHDREADVIAQAGRKGAVTISTNMAGRGTDILLGGDSVRLAAQEAESGTQEHEIALKTWKRRCEEEHEEVVKAGGLHVIGTGEHEAQRIDEQLRGRAGRQGDPGSSMFIVSIQDDVYRRFGEWRDEKAKLPSAYQRIAETIADLPRGDAVESPHVARILNDLRKKVEAENRAIRLEVFKYDGVINDMRNTLYDLRRNVMEAGDSASWRAKVPDILEPLFDEMKRRVKDASEKGDAPGMLWAGAIHERLGRTIFDGEENAPKSAEEANRYLLDAFERRYLGKADEDLAEWERFVLLDSLDSLWSECLSELERIEEGIGLRSYAELNPLVEFRKEAGHVMNRFMLDALDHALRLWLSLDVQASELGSVSASRGLSPQDLRAGFKGGDNDTIDRRLSRAQRRVLKKVMRKTKKAGGKKRPNKPKNRRKRKG